MYGLGISKEGCIVDIGSDLNIITKSGAWYSYGDNRLGQGRENVKEFFKQNPAIANEIEAKIRETVLAGTAKPEGFISDVAEETSN